jgi:hypothetical protein
MLAVTLFTVGTSQAKEGCEKWEVPTYNQALGNGNTKYLAACKVFFKQSAKKTQCDLILDFEKNQKASCLVQMALAKNGGNFSSEDQALSMQEMAVGVIKNSNAIQGNTGTVRSQESEVLYDSCCKAETKKSGTVPPTKSDDSNIAH